MLAHHIDPVLAAIFCHNTVYFAFGFGKHLLRPGPASFEFPFQIIVLREFFGAFPGFREETA